MPTTKTKHDGPLSPAVAAQQAAWHARQAATFFSDSVLNKFTPRGREIARKRFIANARAALPAMGLDEFLKHFKAWYGGNRMDEAEPVIREIWAELQSKPSPDSSNAALAKQLIEAALRLMGESEVSA